MQDKHYPEQIFENILRHVNSDSQKELEIRFHSRFLNLQKGRNDNIFKSNVQPNVFQEVLSLLRKGEIPNLTECEPEEYKVSIINNRPERLITNCNGDVRLMIKTRNVLPRPFSSGDSYVYVNPKGFKIGLATEDIIYDDSRLEDIQQEIQKLSQLNDSSHHKKNIIERNIHRTTFMQHIYDENSKNPFIIFKFDFSIVYSSENSEPTFEIEIEYIGNKQHQFIEDVNNNIKRIAKQFGKNIEIILKLIQKSQVVITWNEHNSVLVAYNKMLTKSHSSDRILFRGAQPETLHYKHLDLIAKHPYFVADKSDGERAHMLCGKDGTVYLISRFLHVIKTDMKCPELSVSVLDIEYFPENNTILLFDILIKNGEDVRVRYTKDRISILKSIDLSKLNQCNAEWNILLKKMYFSRNNSFPKSEITNILNNLNGEYITDGLIFTPSNERYPLSRKWDTLLKWKPQNLNSVDLYIEKGVDKRTNSKGYHLYANSSQIMDLTTKEVGILVKENYDTVQVQFDDSAHSVKLLQKDNTEILRNESTKKILFYPYPFLREDQVFNSLMPDQHIVEFIFNLETKNLQPIRVRYDKSGIGFKGSNYLKIAIDTWHTMVKPILKEHLMRFNTHKSNNTKGGLSNSFLYHNIIKENMIRKCTDYVKLPYFKEMQSFPSMYNPLKKSWIIPAIPEIIDIMKNGMYNYILDEETDEIIIPIPSTIRDSTKLIDLCSGKGGDLWKWIRSDINFVFGIDNESTLLMDQEDAAIKRWKTIKGSGKLDISKISVVFAEMDARAKVSDYLLSKQLLYEFDIASCFFAMHYFFGSQRDFNKFIINVDEMLTFGGYYIGMIMNGERLYNLLRTNNGIYEIKDNKTNRVLCKIQQKYSNDDSTIHLRDTFGLEIEVDIADSILNDYLPTHEQKLNKKEYLVNLSKLQELSESAGLDLVEYKGLSEILNGNSPHHPEKYNISLTEAEKEFTSLFTCFTFKKKTNSLWKRKIITRFPNNEIKKESSTKNDFHKKLPNINYPDMTTYNANNPIKKNRDVALNQSFSDKIEDNRIQYEHIWKGKWNELENIQLDTLKCDSLIYTEKTNPPLFKIITSKTENPKRRNENNARFPPVFSISVKKSKIDLSNEDEEK